MSTKFHKSPQQIKNQMEHWYLDYYGKSHEQIALENDQFIFYDKLKKNIRNEINENYILKESELPVFALEKADGRCILVTTERFINERDEIDFRDFERHNGFNPKIDWSKPFGERTNVKKQGYFHDFTILKKNGELITWELPTGEPGYAFWNVTKKCELIGRKYLK